VELANKEIDNAKPKDRKYKLADNGGLYLHVSPSAAKLWVWRYRLGGMEKNMALGRTNGTTKEARELHFADQDSGYSCTGCRQPKPYCGFKAHGHSGRSQHLG
jgi:hypothetical protein